MAKHKKDDYFKAKLQAVQKSLDKLEDYYWLQVERMINESKDGEYKYKGFINLIEKKETLQAKNE